MTGLAAAYIVSKVDLGKTAHILGSASPWWLVLSAVLTLVTVPPQAWRWQLLLRARGIDESVAWLTRAYFVSYAVGQVLPTGGRRRRVADLRDDAAPPGFGSPIAGSVLLERAIGGAVTLVLAGARLLLAIGRYPIGAVPLDRGALRRRRPIARRVRASSRPACGATCAGSCRSLRQAADRAAGAGALRGIHGYRDHAGTLLAVAAITTARRSRASSRSGPSARAVGDRRSRCVPYVVLGPLLFLVMLVPFTINGLGVREAFFVSFLGKLGVNADAAFATGSCSSS